MLIISGVPEPSMSAAKSAVDESANRTLSPAKAGNPPSPIFEQYYSILVIIIMILNTHRFLHHHYHQLSTGSLLPHKGTRCKKTHWLQ